MRSIKISTCLQKKLELKPEKLDEGMNLDRLLAIVKERLGVEMFNEMPITKVDIKQEEVSETRFEEELDKYITEEELMENSKLDETVGGIVASFIDEKEFDRMFDSQVKLEVNSPTPIRKSSEDLDDLQRALKKAMTSDRKDAIREMKEETKQIAKSNTLQENNKSPLDRLQKAMKDKESIFNKKKSIPPNELKKVQSLKLDYNEVERELDIEIKENAASEFENINDFSSDFEAESNLANDTLDYIVKSIVKEKRKVV